VLLIKKVYFEKEFRIFQGLLGGVQPCTNITFIETGPLSSRW